MSLTRRDVCLLPVLVAAGTAIPAIGAQDDSMPSTVLAFESMPVRGSDRAEMRTIIKGKLATGERVAVHETALPPNGSPHPPHQLMSMERVESFFKLV